MDKFSGGEDEWNAWEFDFKVSARAADANLVGAMEVVEIESKDITAADFSELKDEKWDGLEDKSRQLHTNVTKPLVAVRRIMEKGNEVHFGKECYIRNVHTGERKGGSYVVDIDVNIDEASFTRPAWL